MRIMVPHTLCNEVGKGGIIKANKGPEFIVCKRPVPVIPYPHNESNENNGSENYIFPA